LIVMILSSLRSTARGFRKAPGFLLLTVLTLGVGIGATAAIFTVVNAVLIRPLPYPEPDRVVSVLQTAPGLGLEDAQLSDAIYLIYRSTTRCWKTSASTGTARPP